MSWPELCGHTWPMVWWWHTWPMVWWLMMGHVIWPQHRTLRHGATCHPDCWGVSRHRYQHQSNMVQDQNVNIYYFLHFNTHCKLDSYVLFGVINTDYIQCTGLMPDAWCLMWWWSPSISQSTGLMSDVMMTALGSCCDQNAGSAWAAWRVMSEGWLPDLSAAALCSHGSDPILSNITQLSLSRSLNFKLLLIIHIKYYISLENASFWQCLVSRRFIAGWKWPLSISGIWIFMNNPYSAVKIYPDWRKYSRYLVTGVWGEVCWWHCSVGHLLIWTPCTVGCRMVLKG